MLTAVFLLGTLVGDPAESLAPADATEEDVAADPPQPRSRPAAAHAGGRLLPRSRHRGHGRFAGGRRNQEALDLIVDRLPATIKLTLAGLLFTVALGVVPGIIAGVRPNSLFDRVGNFVALAGVSFPYFWFGQLLILVVAVNLRWVDVCRATI